MAKTKKPVTVTKPHAPPTTATSTAAASSESRPQCRPATGAFPDINRKAMAERIGTTGPHLSYIFKGRREPKSDLFMKLVEEMKKEKGYEDMTSAELNEILTKARADYQRAKKSGTPARKVKVTGRRKKAVSK